MGLRSYLNEYQKKKRPGGRSFPVSQQPARPDSAAMQQRVQEYRVGLTPAEPESAPQQAPEPKTFEEWDAHLAGLENQVKTARTEADLQQMQLDAQPLRPDTADNLAEAYRRLTANRADLTDYEAKIADARKQLAAQKGAQAPDPSWWQSIVEGTPDWLKSLGGPVMEALAFGGVVGGAAAAEVGDMLGAGLTGAAGLVGWHPLEQENKIRELEKQRIAEEVAQSGGGLYDYMKARAEQFAERGADIAQPMFQWSGEAARYLVPGSGVFRDGIPALGNWIFEPEEALTPDDVDRFLGKLMVSAGADPTTYMGVGLYSRGLQLTGQGVKRLPLLAKAGTGLEKLGVGSRLLNTGKVTREGLDAMARLDAIRQVPAFAKWGDKLLAGSKIAKETFQELGPEAAEASWKSYTSALKTSQDDLLKMARTQPAAYRQRLAQALQELGPRAPKSMGDALKAANIAGDLMAPVRGQTIREQVEYGQRAGLLWKPILNTVAAVDRKLPSIGKTLGWLREAVVSRVPLVGPVARVWLAGKTAADTANSELYSALYRFQDEMAAISKNVPEAKKASFAKQVTEFVETGKTSIADENAELARKYAEKFGLGAEFVRRWENVHGVPSPMLSDVVNGTLEGWLGHQFLPGFRKWLASNFKAREVLEGESWQTFDDAWKVSAVKERKLTGKTMAEAEEHLRKVLDVPPEVQIFDTNPDEILKGRFLWAGKRIEAARQLDAALKGLGQADAGAAAALKAAADAEIAEKVTGARNAVADAAKRVDAAREGEAAFVQGRQAARKAPLVAKRAARESALSAARAGEVRLNVAEAGVESASALAAGRAAKGRAVVVAEALVAGAKATAAATPGVMEARAALVQAKKALAAAKTGAALQDGATLLANALGIGAPAGVDAVQLAKEVVAAVRRHIRTNPAIKDADKMLRRANAMLAEARMAAGRVESAQLLTYLRDLHTQAQSAVAIKQTGAKFLTHAQAAEVAKALDVAEDVAKWYEVKEFKATLKAADDDMVEALMEHAPVVPDGKVKGVRDVRDAMQVMRRELRKDAPAALLRHFERVHEQASKLAVLTEDAAGGYAAVNARAVRAARKAAEDQLEKATQRLKEVDPAQWSAQARAEWLARVQRTAKLRLPPNMVNGLELAMKGRMALPETIDDLVRLATTGIEADTADRWLRAMPGLRNGLNAKSLLGHVARFFDHLGTGIRRMILSTPTSAAKDMISTSIWLTVAAKSPESVHANMVQYLRGAVDKDAKAALEAAGALRTTRLSTEAKGHLSRAGKWIEERGLLGTIGKMGGEQVSRGAAWLPNKILDLRQKFDEAARYALYLDRKAAGYTDADAVQDVFAYLGNFNDYASGALERDVLQRFFLFWAWNRRALGFDLRALLEHPFRAKMLLMATAGNATQEHEGLDQWAASRGGFVWGKDRNGNPKLISFGAGSYMNPLWNMLESETLTNVAQGNLKGAAQATFKDVAAMANPLYGGPMEMAANKDSLSGLAINRDATTDLDSRFADHAPAILSFLPKAVQDVLGFEPYEPGGKLAYYRMDPMAKWFLEWTQPGAMTFAQQLSGLVDERRTPGEALLRFGTGVPTYSMPELREDRKLDNHLRDLKLAMVKALDDVDDHPLIMQPDGQVKPNMTSKAGQKLAVAMALAEANGGDARDVLKDDQKLLAMYDLGQRLGIASSRLRRDIPEGKATLNAPTTIKQRKISLSGR